jgi:parvulin-like peptidyl-prolyl isomerase
MNLLRSRWVRRAVMILFVAGGLSVQTESRWMPESDDAAACDFPPPSRGTDELLASFFEMAAGDARVVATVNGAPITSGMVNRQINLALRERTLSVAELERARAALAGPTRELVIDRQLVLQALARKKQAASTADLDAVVEKLKKDLRTVSLDEYLNREKITLEQLRDELAWQAAWQRLLDRELTDDAVAKYFAAHRREFDGTQLRASHILLAVAKNADERAVQKVVDHAAALREQIVAGKLLFSDAARQASIAPSKDMGGDIGFITRHGEQHEAFAAAAFALEKNAISPPVVTPHGVHLIRWTESKPGKATLAQVRDAVRQAAASELFRNHAAAERKSAAIVRME